MTDNKRPDVGWIGVGKMGLPMCGHLLKAGFQVVAFNRAKEKLAPLVGQGATAVDACRDVAAAPVIISMISNDAALRAVALGDDGVLAAAAAGSVYVDMSTVSPTVSAEVAEAADAKGIAYLRAPVSGGVALAEAAKLTVLMSGPAEAQTRALPVFQVMSAKQIDVGAQEEARVLKLLINMMVGSTAALVAEALTYGRRGGLDWDVMLDALGSSAVASPLLGYKLEPLRARDFTATFSIEQMMKDFDLLLASGHAVHAPLPVAAMVRQLLAAAEAQGDGALDFFATVKTMERMAGLAEQKEET
ncbi:MAG: NAD(P)-dependent oxidoreductase [Pseudomonadota bacterium]